MNLCKHENIKLSIQYVTIEQVKLPDLALRIHAPKHIDKIARGMTAIGVLVPILVDANFKIINGSACYQAMKKLGLKEIPVICAAHLSPEERQLAALALNKLTEGASWDFEALKMVFEDLVLKVDVTLSGFETGEVDLIMHSPELTIGEGDPADLDVAPTKHAPVTRAGDVWILGGHRLVCGDVLVAETLKALMRDERAAMTFNDPPYNVPIHGHVTVDNKSQHDEFAMGVGEMSEAEFIQFLTDSLGAMAAYCRDGALNYACMDWRHQYEMSVAGRAVFSELKNICVWDKGMGGMGSLYRSQYEMIFVFKKGTSPHINNIQLGKFGRNRTNVWSYPGVNALGGAERQETLAMHPTVKPTAMIADAILDCTNLNDIVLDGFAGSGTTIIAGERTGRRARCVEIDPGYVDVAIGRWERLTGLQAVLEGQGKTFAEVAADRGVDLHAPALDPALDKEAANVLAD